MNKYQEALDTIKELYEFEESSQHPYNGNIGHEYSTECGILQELVSRATPKKVVYVKLFGDPVATCPHCQGGIFEHNAFNTKIMYSGKHCSHCGQALDWEGK